MTAYAFFLGCNIPARLTEYETSARAVLGRLGIRLVDERQFACCGYPLRNTDPAAFLLSAVKNLALAERAGLDILTLCKCCFGSLKQAMAILAEEGPQAAQARRLLAREGLRYAGRVRVRHLLALLHRDVGPETLRGGLVKRYDGLRVAVQYGCHALRPSRVTGFDDPVNPTLFDDLVRATGAESVDWEGKLECCGAPLTGANDDLAVSLTRRKLSAAAQAGAHLICTACPYCQLQFTKVAMQAAAAGDEAPLPILYPRLLGLCMGVAVAGPEAATEAGSLQTAGSFLTDTGVRNENG
jgi:heterodisulfide reductase subunit B